MGIRSTLSSPVSLSDGEKSQLFPGWVIPGLGLKDGHSGNKPERKVHIPDSLLSDSSCPTPVPGRLILPF